MSLSDTIESLEETPGAVERLAEGVISEELRLRPDGEIFSLAEHVCHLRDIEREGYNERIRRILTEEQPKLADIDGIRLAAERDYNSQDVNAALREFAAARRESLSAIRNLESDQLGRTGVLDGTGPITLEGLISLMREHDSEHLDIVRRLRAKLLTSRAQGA